MHMRRAARSVLRSGRRKFCRWNGLGSGNHVTNEDLSERAKAHPDTSDDIKLEWV